MASLQLLVRVAPSGMPKPSPDVAAVLAGGTAQRDLLEEQRQDEGDQRHGHGGQEDDVHRVRVRVDDRRDLVGRVGVQRHGRRHRGGVDAGRRGDGRRQLCR